MRKVRQLLPSIAAVFAFALCGVFILFWLYPRSAPPAISTAPNPAASVSGSNSSAIAANLDIYNASMAPLMARPLLSPTRKPPELEAALIEENLPRPIEESAPPPTPPPMPPDIAMIGLFERQEGPMALIRSESRLENWVRIGDEIEGWRITRITQKSITLQSNGESVDIQKID